MLDFRLLPLGGTNVGASCYLYELGNTRILIDCGVQPGLLAQTSLPRLELLKEYPPEALVITHAHSDHIGALAVLKIMWSQLPVFMGEATARITLPMLLDAARVGARNGAPMFSERDVMSALQNVTLFKPDEPFEIGEVTLTPRLSGHILGAVGLKLEHTSGFSVWHTADFNTVATPTTDAAFIPPVPEPVDAVVTETTYGTLELPNRKRQNAEFLGQVRRVVQGGGRVLVPTFALGRAQDVLLTLTRQLQGVPIYLDGLTREITRLFAGMPEHLPLSVRNQLTNGTNPFFTPDVTLIESVKQREELIASKHPCVILASSGMLSQGVSPLYARAILQEPESAILIVGYQDAESAGRQLLEGRDTIRLGIEEVVVSCHIERFYLSAHADRLGILQHLSRYPSGRLVLLHGEGAARFDIFESTKKDHRVARPEVGEWVDLTEKPREKHKTFQGPNRVKRFKTEVTLTREGNRLVLELPPGFDPALTPDGLYRLEAEHSRVAKLSLTEKLGGNSPVVTDVSQEEEGTVLHCAEGTSEA